jgi:hypothetical protein
LSPNGNWRAAIVVYHPRPLTSRDRKIPTVQLLHDPHCPHVAHARARLRQACEQAGVAAQWSEQVRDPRADGSYAPPTILIDGRDVAELAQSLPECCRVPTGAIPVPELTVIVKALETDRVTAPTSGRARWRSTAAMVPGILAALLPRITCPSCWPAYAGFLGAVGLPILMDVRWLLPLTAASLLLAIAALAIGARRRRGYAPLLIGLGAAALVLIGKFVFASNPATYLGTAALVCASVWNAWPRRSELEAAMRRPASQVAP